MIKQTMKRKQPSFNEGSYGYSTFRELLEDARDQGIVEIARNQKAGGTWLVTGLGGRAGGQKTPGEGAGAAGRGCPSSAEPRAGDRGAVRPARRRRGGN